MIRLRLILLVLATVLGLGEYYIAYSALPNMIAIPLRVAGVILWLAAVTIFSFSFPRVRKNPECDLCYEAKNPYWKMMKKFYGDAWKDRMSLCKSYWLTALFFFLWVALLAGLGVALYGMGLVALAAIADPTKALWVFLVLAGVVAAIIGMMQLCQRLTKKFPTLEYVWVTLGIVIVAFVIVVLPICEIHENRQVSYASASGLYGEWAVGIVLAVGAVVLIVAAAFRYFPALRDTWLGQLFATIKGPLCPTLVACTDCNNTAA